MTTIFNDFGAVDLTTMRFPGAVNIESNEVVKKLNEEAAECAKKLGELFAVKIDPRVLEQLGCRVRLPLEDARDFNKDIAEAARRRIEI